MQNVRTFGVILLAVGIVIIVAAVGADVLGLGQADAFGFKQIAGAIAGGLVALIGSFMLMRKHAT